MLLLLLLVVVVSLVDSDQSRHATATRGTSSSVRHCRHE